MFDYIAVSKSKSRVSENVRRVYVHSTQCIYSHRAAVIISFNFTVSVEFSDTRFYRLLLYYVTTSDGEDYWRMIGRIVNPSRFQVSRRSRPVLQSKDINFVSIRTHLNHVETLLVIVITCKSFRFIYAYCTRDGVWYTENNEHAMMYDIYVQGDSPNICSPPFFSV